MKTILISTSSLWNCGDEFIRNGVLNLLNIKPDVGTIWWNRANGVRPVFANDIKLNARLCDYFIVAGTPTWINRTEYIYKYCLSNRIPIALIGVGTRGGIWNFRQRKLIKELAESGLVEVCMVRDKLAFDILKSYGLNNVIRILDPAFFVTPLTADRRINILGWRDYTVSEKLRTRDYLKRTVDRLTGRYRTISLFADWYNGFMQSVFHRLSEPKLVIVHDNREIEKARRLFGKDYVFYSTDYREIFKRYSAAKSYIGSRIHGTIPSIIHGASANVLYYTDKANVIESSSEILSKYIKDIDRHVKVTYFKDRDIDPENDFVYDEPDIKAIRRAIEEEKQFIRKELKQTAVLSEYLK